MVHDLVEQGHDKYNSLLSPMFNPQRVNIEKTNFVIFHSPRNKPDMNFVFKVWKKKNQSRNLC